MAANGYLHTVTFYRDGFKVNFTSSILFTEFLYKKVLCVSFGTFRWRCFFNYNIGTGEGWLYHTEIFCPFARK